MSWYYMLRRNQTHSWFQKQLSELFKVLQNHTALSFLFFQFSTKPGLPQGRTQNWASIRGLKRPSGVAFISVAVSTRVSITMILWRLRVLGARRVWCPLIPPDLLGRTIQALHTDPDTPVRRKEKLEMNRFHREKSFILVWFPGFPILLWV